jgi:sphingolipid C9-methyltransferase
MHEEIIKSNKILDFVVPKASSVLSRYKNGVKVPITTFIEDYMNGRVNVTCDLQELLQNRKHFFSYRFVGHHINFFLRYFIPSVVVHSKKQD